MTDTDEVMHEVWGLFKGGTSERLPNRVRAESVAESVETAREQTWNGVPIVKVYLDSEDDWNESLQEIVDEYGLVEVERDSTGRGFTISFAKTEQDAEIASKATSG